MAEGHNSKIIEKIHNSLHPTLLNKDRLGFSDRAIIFLLPYQNSHSTVDALESLPYPVITVNMTIDDGFPADMGTMIGNSFYITREGSRLLSYLMASIGANIDYTQDPRVVTPKSHDIHMAEGGTLAMDNRSRRAITSSNDAFLSFQQEGYRTSTIAPDTIIDMAKQFKNDWVYQVHTKGGWLSGPSHAHIDPLVTLFSDRNGYRTFVDEYLLDEFESVMPPNWNIEPTPHEEVLGGALNLAYIDANLVLAPPRENMGALAQTLERSGYDLIHLPQDTVANKAGPKCRTLVVPL